MASRIGGIIRPWISVATFFRQRAAAIRRADRLMACLLRLSPAKNELLQWSLASSRPYDEARQCGNADDE